MDNNENIEKDCNNRISRKKLIISVIISVIAFILIVAIYKVISYNIGPEKLFKQQVSKYLQEKYNEDFNIKFMQKRNASEYEDVGCDGSHVEMWNGTNKNIKEYIYSFSPKKNTNIICYVAYAHNLEDDSYKIYETTSGRQMCGDDPSRADKSYYENALRYYNQKLEIKDSLEGYFGKGYMIDLYDSDDAIEIKTNKSLEKIVLNEYEEFTNLFNSIVELLKDKEIYVKIRYSDTSISIREDSEIEKNHIINGILESK